MERDIVPRGTLLLNCLQLALVTLIIKIFGLDVQPFFIPIYYLF